MQFRTEIRFELIGRFRLTTECYWQGPGTRLTVICRLRQVNLLNFNKDFMSKVIFRGRTIPAGRKPELITIIS